MIEIANILADATGLEGIREQVGNADVSCSCH